MPIDPISAGIIGGVAAPIATDVVKETGKRFKELADKNIAECDDLFDTMIKDIKDTKNPIEKATLAVFATGFAGAIGTTVLVCSAVQAAVQGPAKAIKKFFSET